jgi:hypothetical protein
MAKHIQSRESRCQVANTLRIFNQKQFIVRLTLQQRGLGLIAPWAKFGVALLMHGMKSSSRQ